MKTILIADADHHSRNSSLEFFEQRGYATIGAANGKEAFETWDQNNNISIVILEADLPIVNGLVVLEIMRGCDPTVKAILTSSKRSHRAEAIQTKVPFMLKPFSLEDLLQAVITEIGPA